MAFSHIWHKLHLHRKKIAFAGLVVFLLLSNLSGVFAQKKIKQDNKPNYDAKKIHYGFYLSLPLTRFNTEYSQAYADQLQSRGANAMTINPKVSPGFYTGLVLNVGLADYLDFRFVPGVGFYTRTLEYANMQAAGSEPRTENVSLGSTSIELPLLLQYKSKRRTNYRMYFVGGIKPAIDLNSRKNDQPGENLRTDNIDLALEYGVGLDMFYPYFKFAPELRFSHGLLNQLIPDDNVYSNNLRRLTTHNVSLILFFE